MRRTGPILLLLGGAAMISGCDVILPYDRPGAWRPMDANAANLGAMAADRGDLVRGVDAAGEDGQLTTAAVERLRRDRVRKLPDSGVAQVVPVGNGTGGSAAAGGGN